MSELELFKSRLEIKNGRLIWKKTDKKQVNGMVDGLVNLLVQVVNLKLKVCISKQLGLYG